MLSLQGMAGIGIPGTAGTKGEEGEQVGWEFCSEICIKILSESPVFRFSLESRGSTWKKNERIKNLGLKIRAFTVSSVVFRE